MSEPCEHAVFPFVEIFRRESSVSEVSQIRLIASRGGLPFFLIDVKTLLLISVRIHNHMIALQFFHFSYILLKIKVALINRNVPHVMLREAFLSREYFVFCCTSQLATIQDRIGSSRRSLNPGISLPRPV
jgi:hypothetical protein